MRSWWLGCVWSLCVFADPIIDRVEGIVLIGVGGVFEGISQDDLGKEPIRWIQLKLPGRSKELRERLAPFLGRPLTREDLVQMKREVILYYRDCNHPLVIVSVPEQEVTNGIVQLLVKESRIDQIKVYGNRFFSEKRYRRAIHLEPGDFIDEDILLSDIQFLNRNSFRRVDVLYAEGDSPQTTNVELIVKDRFPLSAVGGIDNAGIAHTNPFRWFAGVTWGNVLGLDHTFSAQYIATLDNHKFRAITGSYLMPLPIQHVLSFYGGYSEVHAHVPYHSRTEGKSWQASARYTIPLPPSPWMLHEMTWGYDVKQSNNTVNFVEELPVIGQNVNLSQFMAGYQVGYERDYPSWKHKVGFTIELFFSPFTWLPHQSKIDFHSLNPFADPIYVYGRAALNYKVVLPKGFEGVFLCTAQLSNQSLLPSEELGIGGYNTVRGYEERELNADDGVIVTTELYLPKMTFIRKPFQDRLSFLLFADYGFAHYNHRLPKEAQSAHLLGAGPGLRYMMENYFSVRIDWGIKCHPANYGGGFSMVHFGVTGSF